MTPFVQLGGSLKSIMYITLPYLSKSPAALDGGDNDKHTMVGKKSSQESTTSLGRTWVCVHRAKLVGICS